MEKVAATSTSRSREIKRAEIKKKLNSATLKASKKKNAPYTSRDKLRKGANSFL